MHQPRAGVAGGSLDGPARSPDNKVLAETSTNRQPPNRPAPAGRGFGRPRAEAPRDPWPTEVCPVAPEGEPGDGGKEGRVICANGICEDENGEGIEGQWGASQGPQ